MKKSSAIQTVDVSYCVHMKSSMTSEDLTTTGRPYGGVGFVCKQKAGFTYEEIKCDSDRGC